MNPGTTGFAVILAASLAALGYLCKAALEWIKTLADEHRRRRSRLVQLESLLRVSTVAFNVQAIQRERLIALVEYRLGKALAYDGQGFEQFFVDNFASFAPEEKELHKLIRAYTIDAIRPANIALLEWIRQDDYFKAQTGPGLDELADALGTLEVHQILWLAKYEAWVPQDESHALVYLDDEKKQGIAFPSKIDGLVEPARSILERSFLGKIEKLADRFST